MAASKAHLRAVTAQDKPTERLPMSVSDALERGDELDLILAERRIVASRLDNDKTPARDIAALMKRMSEIQGEIKVLEAAERSAQEATADVDESDDSFDASAI